MKSKPKNPSSRYLLPYFMESKIWLVYEDRVTNNHAYWVTKEPERARKMFAARSGGKHRGYTVQDYLYDLMDCAQDSRLKSSTIKRLLDEIDELDKFHSNMDTLDALIAYPEQVTNEEMYAY